MIDENELDGTGQMALFDEAELKGDELTQINALAIDLDNLCSNIDQVEAHLKSLKEKKKEISENLLPELMNLVGMKSFVLNNGQKVNLTTFYDAKIKDQGAAFAYLEDKGDTAIIKDTITCNFDRGEIERANAVAKELADKGVPVSRKEAIHPSTLKAYVREAIETGQNIPHDAFGIYIGNRVIIK